MIYLIHFAATWAMIGGAWFVLVVHYPAFGLFSKDHFQEFEKFHIRRTLSLGIPVMLVEAVTAAILAAQGGLFVVNIFLLAVIWFLTFNDCMKCHLSLKEGYSSSILKQLMYLHGTRVGLWSLRGILLFLVKIPS